MINSFLILKDDCVSMSTSHYKWDPRDCEEQKYFVCEAPADLFVSKISDVETGEGREIAECSAGSFSIVL